MIDGVKIFFDSQDTLWRIVICAPLLYFAIIGFVRLSGKRCTSQMNNFDWIVTVALGSIMASGILLKDVTVIEALLAIGILLLMQFALTALSVRSDVVDHAVKAQPRLLVERGCYLPDEMRKERITEQEILAAIRERGLRSVDQAEWVILESDASFSVIPRSTRNKAEDLSALKSVTGFTAESPDEAPAT